MRFDEVNSNITEKILGESKKVTDFERYTGEGGHVS